MAGDLITGTEEAQIIRLTFDDKNLERKG